MVSKHGSPFELDRQCVGHVFMSFTCVIIILVIYMHVHKHGVGHGCSDIGM